MVNLSRNRQQPNLRTNPQHLLTLVAYLTTHFMVASVGD
jgi:hypothetical protein